MAPRPDRSHWRHVRRRRDTQPGAVSTDAQQANLDAAQRAKNEQQGIASESMNPEDRDREIYECYCELDIAGFEHKKDGKIVPKCTVK